MYILNNIHDRNYRSIYKEIENVIFDISEKQISNTKNSAWNEISVGSIVCVVRSSRKISTFFRVKSKYGIGDTDPDYGETYVLTGEVIAKLTKEADMTTLLNKYDVTHPYLPDNKFSIGFNVANLGNSLDKLAVGVKGGSIKSLRELYSCSP